MKYAIGILSLLVSFSAMATEEKTAKIFLSCSAITYDGKHAIQLVVKQLKPNKFRAKVKATNGESLTIDLKESHGQLIPEKNKVLFAVWLYGMQEGEIILNWSSHLLAMSYYHQPMKCVTAVNRIR